MSWDFYFVFWQKLPYCDSVCCWQLLCCQLSEMLLHWLTAVWQFILSWLLQPPLDPPPELSPEYLR